MQRKEKKTPRFFADLCIRPASHKEAVHMIRTLIGFGYRIIGVEARNDINIESLRKEFGGGILQRITLRVNNKKEFNRVVSKKLVNNNIIVSVETRSLEVARLAAVSKKVDLLTLVPGLEKAVDKSTRTLLSQKGFGGIEIVLSYITRNKENRSHIRVWKYYYQSLRRASGYMIPATVSSCAESVFELWHPMQIVGFASLFDVPMEITRSWITNVSRVLGRIHYSAR